MPPAPFLGGLTETAGIEMNYGLTTASYREDVYPFVYGRRKPGLPDGGVDILGCLN
jgi:hypothetical protein